MIPLKRLDEKNFIQLMEEARQGIHRWSHEWSDENQHDPGITLLEMMSWLTEMQRYYLNRVTDRDYRSLLKLHGISKSEPQSARTLVTFFGCKDNVTLPKRMKIQAEEQIFETETPLYYLNNTIRKVWVKNQKSIDVTHINNQEGIYFHVFGSPVKKDSEMVLALNDPLPHGVPLQMYFDIKEHYSIEMGMGRGLKTFEIKWYACGEETAEIEIIRDHTDNFRRGGIVCFQLKQPHSVTNWGQEQGYLLKIKALGDSAALPPEVNSIRLNVVEAKNCNTIVDVLTANEPHFPIEEELLLGGLVMQGSRDGTKWMDIHYTLGEAPKEKSIKAAADFPYYRIIAWDDSQLQTLVIGSSTGVPGQKVHFRGDDLLHENWMISIAHFEGKQRVWTDWKYTEDLLKAQEEDKVFTYDPEEDAILFGNNENGEIPRSGPENIRLLTLQKYDGERGNVKKGKIDTCVKPGYPAGLQVVNILDAHGGAAKLTLEEQQKEVIKDYSQVYRAVTAEDYTRLLCNAPGYRIAYIKILPNHLAENQVSIVVVPYNGQLKPSLDSVMTQALRSYLEDFRLITTRVDFVSPVYVKVSLSAIIQVRNRNRYDSNKLATHLKTILTPIRGLDINPNYGVGTIPNPAEMIQEILKDPEVYRVDHLAMDAKGLGARKNPAGEIILPPNAIIYAGDIYIDIRD